MSIPRFGGTADQTSEARQRRATSDSLGCKPQEIPETNVYVLSQPANAGDIVLGFTPRLYRLAPIQRL